MIEAKNGLLSLLLVLLFSLSSTANADIKAGQAAILKGDFSRAFKE